MTNLKGFEGFSGPIGFNADGDAAKAFFIVARSEGRLGDQGHGLQRRRQLLIRTARPYARPPDAGGRMRAGDSFAAAFGPKLKGNGAGNDGAPSKIATMLLQQLVNGLTLGAVYTLVALSFSLVMGLLAILNIAIGELFMLGGYLGFAVIAAHFPLAAALLIGMAGAALVALVIDKIGYEPLRHAPPITPLLSTIGFSIILQNVVTNVWGSDPLQLPSELFDRRVTLGPVQIGVMQMVVVGVTVVLVAAVALPDSEDFRRPGVARGQPKTARWRDSSACRRAGSRCSLSCCPARSPAPPAC
jgi:hypothetical protein